MTSASDYPATETFTDAHGRPAVRYLTDDTAHGIAAGSEVLTPVTAYATTPAEYVAPAPRVLTPSRWTLDEDVDWFDPSDY